MTNINNYNYNLFDVLLENIAASLIKKSIYPSYLKIRGILRRDGVINNASFHRRYDTHEEFIKVYTRAT